MSEPWTRYWIKDPFWGGIDYGLQGSLRLLPVETASNLGARLGTLAGKYRYRNLRERVTGNLKRIVPEKSSAEREALAASMWSHLGRTLVEITMLDRMRDPRFYTMENEENVLVHANSGRGYIMLFPHLANWEMIAIGMQSLGIRTTSVIEEIRNRFQRDLVRRTRASLNHGTIAPDFAGMRRIPEILRAGGVVGFAMDEFVGGNVVAPRFGRSVNARTNVQRTVKLARRHDAPILPAYCVRTAPTRFILKFLPAITPGEGDDAALEKKINDLCEDLIRKHPDQWYMLHRMRLRS